MPVMKCEEGQFEFYDLDGLPDGTVVHWNHIGEAGKHKWRDEDMLWLEMNNGVSIDAGAYGYHREYLRVDVCWNQWGWSPIETSVCRDEAEMASEAVRLANKWNTDQMRDIARGMAHEALSRHAHVGWSHVAGGSAIPVLRDSGLPGVEADDGEKEGEKREGWFCTWWSIVALGVGGAVLLR